MFSNTILYVHIPIIIISDVQYYSICYIQRSSSTEAATTGMECDVSNSRNDQDITIQSDNKITSDTNITTRKNSTPQHKLSNNDLKDMLVNSKMTDSPMLSSTSFQERKVLFIEAARRLVE